MNKKVVTFYLTLMLTIGNLLYSQTVQIDTFYLVKSKQFIDLQAEEMYFPVFRSNSKAVDSLINSDVKNRFTNYDFEAEGLDSALTKWANDQVVYLDFEVTYNQNYFLSFNITLEGCGAYCSQSTEYFNYSTKSGEWLRIDDVIDTTGTFRKIAIDDKRRQYEQAMIRVQSLLNDSSSGLTQEDYEFVSEFYSDCEDDFDFREFLLYPDAIEIIGDCHLPHVMQSMNPDIELKYKFSDLGLKLKTIN